MKKKNKNTKKNNVKKNSKMSAGKKVAIGTGVVVAGVTSAGAYYLMGPNSKAHQKKASILMAKIKKEVAQKVAKARNLTEPLYYNAVDTLATAYSKQYEAHEEDIKALAKKLKSDWKRVANVASKKVKKSVRTIKKKTKNS